MPSSSSRRVLPIVACYVLVAFVAYGHVTPSFFLSDDFSFLDAVRSSGRWWWPRHLQGDVFRPATMLLFRIEYAIWGLRSFGFHLGSLALHTSSALFLFGITRRVTERTSVAFWTGLLFLVFAGHAEPVNWISASTDVLATFWSLASIWFLGRALDQRSRWRDLVCSYATFGASLLSKESVLTVPAVFAWLELCALFEKWRAGSATWSSAGFACLRLSGFAVLVMGYFGLRLAVLHVFFGTYAGFDASAALGNLSFFLSRTFFPVGLIPWLHVTAYIEARLAVIIFGVAIVLAWRRRSLMPLLPAVALLITLVPALPLSMGMDDTQGERFIYLPSAFSAMLTMMIVNSLFWRRGRVMAVGLAALICVANLVALERVNQRFVEAGQLSQGIVSSFGSNVGTLPAGPSKVFVLNLPDTYLGVYVFRNGFREAVEIFHPRAANGRFVFSIVGHSFSSVKENISTTQTSPGVFHVNVGPETFPSPRLLPSSFYAFPDQGSHDFDLQFTEAIDRALVLYTSRGMLNTAGVIENQGVPIGFIDAPAADASCARVVRFSGWALLNTPSGSIVVVRDRIAGIDGESSNPLIEMGAGHWMPVGHRPDVEYIFSGFANSDRAGWEYQLVCSELPKGATGVNVHVIVRDDRGRSADMGTRFVLHPSGGPDIPFGHIDIPPPDIRCDGVLRFAGWALLSTPAGNVTIARDRIAGVDGGSSNQLVDVGLATWQAEGTRPDVRRAFPNFSNSSRAGWDYRLACSSLPPGTASVRLHVIVRDGEGRVAEIGTRVVR